jgi:hypothetical protein
MTKYFFDVRNGDIFTKDREGSEFLDDEAAMRDALVMAREFAIDDLQQPKVIADRTIEIRDLAGRSVMVFRARDVLESDQVPRVA